MVFLTFSQEAKAAVLTDSLLGYWRFDGNVTDFSGDGSTGNLAGTTVPTYDPSSPFPDSQSLNFSSINNSTVTFANQTNLRPETAVSLSMWIYLNANPASSSVIAGNYLDGYNGGFFFTLNPTVISFSVGDGNLLSGTASFPTSSIPVATWVMLTGTWDGTTIKIYKNDALSSSTAFTGSAAFVGTAFEIGNFLGKIDEMRLYDRALSLSEIGTLASGGKLSANWVGTYSTNYDMAYNWSPEIIPDPYTLVTIDVSVNNPSFTTNETMAGLTITPGASLDIGSFNLAINNSGTFSNLGILSLNNVSTQVLSGFVNDTTNGTVRINNFASITGIKSGYYYNNLIINAGVTTLTLGANLTTHGNLNLESGTLDVSGSNYGVTVNGNWNSASASNFNARQGTVILNGTDQSIAGSNIFYNLAKTVSTADILTFAYGNTQTILGTTTLQGAGSAAQFLSLRSSATGQLWQIDPQGARNISAVDVQDSTNINATAISLPGRNINSGNNTNWTFDTAPPEISLDSVNATTANNYQPVMGTATEMLATILSVQFQMDTTGGNWTACVASDGTFNDTTETFTCTPATALSDGTHTMYVRATDTNNNVTATTYPSVSFVLDIMAPDLSLDPISSPSKNSYQPISGTVIDALVTVASTEFQVDTTGGNWTPCTANDGTFNSLSEVFTCTPDSAMANGTHTVYVRATDSVSNVTTATFPSVSFTIDTTTPGISAVSAVSGETSANISWLTDKAASSIVDYGVTSSYGTSTTENSMVASHTVLLSGLNVCTTYHYRARSIDNLSNESLSADQTFTTLGCLVPTEPENDSDDSNNDSSSDSCEEDAPGKPKFTDASAQDAYSIKLYYDKASGSVDHYELKYGTESGSYKWEVNDIDDSDDTFLVKELSASQTYYFKIRAVNDCEEGDWSSETSEKTQTADTATTISDPDETTSLGNNLPSSGASTATVPKIDFNGDTTPNWQTNYFGSAYCYEETRCGGTADPDKDGINNNEEFRLGTDPLKSDSDQDGTADGAEIEAGRSPVKSGKSGSSDRINYENPKDKGETKKESYKVNNVEMIDDSSGNKRLKVSGKALPNRFVTVYVYSDPIVLTVETDDDGNWSYILEKDLEDGEHEVYVAVTDSNGKIAQKSEPLTFVKAAEAITIIPPAEASATDRAKSPVEAGYQKNLALSIFIGIGALILSIVTIGFIRHKKMQVE